MASRETVTFEAASNRNPAPNLPRPAVLSPFTREFSSRQLASLPSEPLPPLAIRASPPFRAAAKIPPLSLRAPRQRHLVSRQPAPAVPGVYNRGPKNLPEERIALPLPKGEDQR